jgi:hypothetical protein
MSVKASPWGEMSSYRASLEKTKAEKKRVDKGMYTGGLLYLEKKTIHTN